MKHLWKHPWIVGATNLLLIMAIYTLSRLFFYWVNIDLYPNVSFAHLIEMLAGGVRFDMTALLYLNSLYINERVVNIGGWYFYHYHLKSATISYISIPLNGHIGFLIYSVSSSIA